MVAVLKLHCDWLVGVVVTYWRLVGCVDGGARMAADQSHHGHRAHQQQPRHTTTLPISRCFGSVEQKKVSLPNNLSTKSNSLVNNGSS
jgi:hypothetical protein